MTFTGAAALPDYDGGGVMPLFACETLSTEHSQASYTLIACITPS